MPSVYTCLKFIFIGLIKMEKHIQYVYLNYLQFHPKECKILLSAIMKNVKDNFILNANIVL